MPHEVIFHSPDEQSVIMRVARELAKLGDEIDECFTGYIPRRMTNVWNSTQLGGLRMWTNERAAEERRPTQSEQQLQQSPTFFTRTLKRLLLTATLYVLLNLR
ncbi:unnamed protein product [Dicrocoelium dendriticum]|nr:unnamed protein product [Dicrocoelium dendriticum]